MKGKKLVSLALAFIMLLTLLPGGVMAAEEQQPQSSEQSNVAIEEISPDNYEGMGDNTPEGAVPIGEIAENQPILQQRSIHLPEDTDWVRFDAVAGRVYDIAVQNLENGLDPFLSLYDSDAQTSLQVCNDAVYMKEPTAARIVYRAQKTAALYIKITSRDSRNQGNYTLSVAWSSHPVLTGSVGPYALGVGITDFTLQLQTLNMPTDQWGGITSQGIAVALEKVDDAGNVLETWNAESVSVMGAPGEGAIRASFTGKALPAVDGRLRVRVDIYGEPAVFNERVWISVKDEPIVTGVEQSSVYVDETSYTFILKGWNLDNGGGYAPAVYYMNYVKAAGTYLPKTITATTYEFEYIPAPNALITLQRYVAGLESDNRLYCGMEIALREREPEFDVVSIVPVQERREDIPEGVDVDVTIKAYNINLDLLDLTYKHAELYDYATGFTANQCQLMRDPDDNTLLIARFTGVKPGRYRFFANITNADTWLSASNLGPLVIDSMESYPVITRIVSDTIPAGTPKAIIGFHGLHLLELQGRLSRLELVDDAGRAVAICHAINPGNILYRAGSGTYCEAVFTAVDAVNGIPEGTYTLKTVSDLALSDGTDWDELAVRCQQIRAVTEPYLFGYINPGSLTNKPESYSQGKFTMTIPGINLDKLNPSDITVVIRNIFLNGWSTTASAIRIEYSPGEQSLGGGSIIAEFDFAAKPLQDLGMAYVCDVLYGQHMEGKAGQKVSTAKTMYIRVANWPVAYAMQSSGQAPAKKYTLTFKGWNLAGKQYTVRLTPWDGVSGSNLVYETELTYATDTSVTLDMTFSRELQQGEAYTVLLQEQSSNLAVGTGLLSITQATTDTNAFTAILNQAKTLHADAAEGAQVGQYPAGAKMALQNAIAAAEALLQDPYLTQSKVDYGVQMLYAALYAFEAAKFTPPAYTALGDSITLGMSAVLGTGYTNLLYQYMKTTGAFDSLPCKNLGALGETSGELLARLNADPVLRRAVADARYVTVSIGGNNLLGPVIKTVCDAYGIQSENNPLLLEELKHALSQDSEAEAKLTAMAGSAELMNALQQGVAGFTADWAEIPAKIRELTPHGAVYVNTVYNPFKTEDPLHAAFEPLIQAINGAITATAALHNYKVVDVYTLFKNSQGNSPPVDFDLKSLKVDPHPNSTGHQVIFNGLLTAAQKEINLDVLKTTIVRAQSLLNGAHAGSNPGDYPQAAIDALRTAIQTATAVRDNGNATAQECTSAIITLKNAISTFEAARIQPPPPPPPATPVVMPGAGAPPAPSLKQQLELLVGNINEASLPLAIELINKAAEPIRAAGNAEEAMRLARAILEDATGLFKTANDSGLASKQLADVLAEVYCLAMSKVNGFHAGAAPSGNRSKAVVPEVKLIHLAQRMDRILQAAAAMNQELEAAGLAYRVRPILVVDAAASGSYEEAIVELNEGILKTVKDKGLYGIVLDMGIGKVLLKPGSLPAGELRAELRRVTAGNQPVYELVVQVNGAAAEKFQNALEIVLPYTPAQGIDLDTLTVYSINDEGRLENLAGVYDAVAGGVRFMTRKPGRFVIKANPQRFNDLTGVAWAEKAIGAMVAKGITAGMGGGRFKPQDSVTRAQFVTMLVNQFQLLDDKAECSFTDVKKKDWYYRFIAAAVKHGLVSAKSDGSFGPNDPLTRREMAVILAKVLQTLLGKEVPAKPEQYLQQYTDAARMSLQDKRSTALVVYNYIMSGLTRDTFGGGEKVNRAQAAMVIHNLMKLKD